MLAEVAKWQCSDPACDLCQAPWVESRVVTALTWNICCLGTEEVQHFPRGARHSLCWDEDWLAHSPEAHGKTLNLFLLFHLTPPCCCNVHISHLQQWNLLQRAGQNIRFLYIQLLPFLVAFQFFWFFQAQLQLLTFLPTGLIYRLHTGSFLKHQLLWQAGFCHGLFAMGLLLIMSCWPPHSTRLDQASPCQPIWQLNFVFKACSFWSEVITWW